MKYDRSRAGLRLKPSAYGLIEFHLTNDMRATLIGIDATGSRIRLQRDDKPTPETWARRFWIPLRGNRQWNQWASPSQETKP